MAIKDLWTRVGRWRGVRSGGGGGTISVEEPIGVAGADADRIEPAIPSRVADTSQMVVKSDTTLQRVDGAERLGEAFDRLIDKLGGINDHLDKQVGQHEDLMERLESLPEVLNSLPGAVENQRKVVDTLIEQLKGKALKDQQIAETLEKIPEQATKQTNALGEMNQKLSVAAEIDAQMSQGFSRFNDTLGRLDSDTVSQTESIMQMNKTFTASDRYLKYIMTRQNKRFLWIFITAMAVSTTAIAALITALIIVLKQ